MGNGMGLCGPGHRSPVSVTRTSPIEPHLRDRGNLSPVRVSWAGHLQLWGYGHLLEERVSHQNQGTIFSEHREPWPWEGPGKAFFIPRLQSQRQLPL